MTDIKRRTAGPEGLRLWFSVLGPPLAWLVQFMLSYPLVPLACAMGGRTILFLLAGLMALVDITAGVLAWQSWRRMTPQERGSLVNHMEGTRVGFLIFAGLLASGIFFLAIVLSVIPMLFMQPCLPVRTI